MTKNLKERKKWGEHTIWTEFLKKEIENLKNGVVSDFLIESLEGAYKETELNDGLLCSICSKNMVPMDTKWRSSYKFPVCETCLRAAANYGWR